MAQNCPQGRGFCLFFFAPGPGFRKNFLLGGREFDYLKKFSGGQPGGGMLVLGID